MKETWIAGYSRPHPWIMNAAGTCKSYERVRELAATETAAIVYGSSTYQPRLRNAGTVFYKTKRFSQNSFGIDNEGGEYHRTALPGMVRVAHDAGKLFIWSVAGDTPEEYAIMTEIGKEAGVDIVEQNLGCSNKWKGAVQDEIPSYNPDLVREIVMRTHERVGLTDLFLKVSWLDPFSLKRLARMIVDDLPVLLVKGMVTINTIANTLSYDEHGNPRITPGGGLAGLGGPAIRQMALGQVAQWRAVLPYRIAVIGVGGIRESSHVADYLDRAGASAVQVATALFGESYEERNFNLLTTLVDKYLRLHNES